MAAARLATAPLRLVAGAIATPQDRVRTMIKATGKGPNGEDILFIGLSFGNLDRFRERPLDTFIRIDGKEIGLTHDVLIFSGKTEAEMADALASGFGPDTKVSISGRSKN